MASAHEAENERDKESPRRGRHRGKGVSRGTADGVAVSLYFVKAAAFRDKVLLQRKWRRILVLATARTRQMQHLLIEN